jgi:hypothetical protein
MTREEVADKLAELAYGIRAGKVIQERILVGDWKDLNSSKDFEWIKELAWRVKPEPQYIPFTADDWREFDCKNVRSKDDGTCLLITDWNVRDVTLACGLRKSINLTYKTLCDEYVFDTTGKPVGKEVKDKYDKEQKEKE